MLVIGDGATVISEILVSTCMVERSGGGEHPRCATPSSSTPQAKVTGALHAPAIFVDRGILVFDGSCKMAPLDDVENSKS